jgi:hypothetical protein
VRDGDWNSLQSERLRPTGSRASNSIQLHACAQRFCTSLSLQVTLHHEHGSLAGTQHVCTCSYNVNHAQRREKQPHKYASPVDSTTMFLEDNDRFDKRFGRAAARCTCLLWVYLYNIRPG